MISPPNLLWIFVDQLRYHALSCLGDPNIRTPHIDRLFQEGVSFTNAVSTCPICTPARGAVMTGQYCTSTDILYLGDLLEPSQRTAAHAFRDAGYRTSYVGKWHLSSQQNPYGHNEGAEYWVHPKMRGGFEDWMGFELSNHFWKTRYCTDGRIWPPKMIQGYQTDGLTSLSLEYLSGLSANSQPWFHVLSYEAPHHGADQNGVVSVTVGDFSHTRHPAPPEYEERFDGRNLILRENVPDSHNRVARSMLAQYYAMISNLDDNIGRVLDFLDESGQAENTLVCFFSDHGEMGGSHGRFQKTDPREESVRVPLLMRWPRDLQTGLISDPANLVDILPTCCGLCGIAGPDELEGVDFSGRLRGHEMTKAREGTLIQWHGNPRYTPGSDHDRQWRALRTENETYVIFQDGEIVLYDNSVDPFQLKNVVEDESYSARRIRLHELLVQEVQTYEDEVPSYLKI